MPDKSTIKLGDISVDVELKKIKNIHMRIYSQNGRVYMSVPEIIGFEGAKKFAEKKIDWITKNLAKYANRPQIKPLQFISGEQHFFLGKKYSMQIIEKSGRPEVTISDDIMILQVKPLSDTEGRKKILDKWYRKQLEQIIPQIISKWEPVIKVNVTGFTIRKMKTKWGVCNIKTKKIRINLELAKRSLQIIEYIVVHEMVNLLERRHNKKFYSYMDFFLPDWRQYKSDLSRIPVR